LKPANQPLSDGAALPSLAYTHAFRSTISAALLAKRLFFPASNAAIGLRVIVASGMDSPFLRERQWRIPGFLAL
jgi:hypothetical protein